MLQQILAVFFVLLLLLAALWLLRSRGAGSGIPVSGFHVVSNAFSRRSPDRQLRLLERLTLTPQHSLHLVSVEDRVVLFATSPSGCQAIEQTGISERPMATRDGAAC